MKNWNKKRLARLAATSVAIGVAITLVSPGTASAAAVAPNNDRPSGAVTHQPDRPDVPDAHMKNPTPSAPPAPSDPGPGSSAPANSGVGQAPSAPSAAPEPQRKDKPPDRDAHKFSPAKRTPAGQQSPKRDNNKNDNKDDQESAATPAPAWQPAPAPAPTPAPAPGFGQGTSPLAGPAALLNGMNNVLVSANETVNKVLTDANDAVNRVLGRLPTPQQQQLEPGLTVVEPAETPAPDSETQEHDPAADRGTQLLDDEDIGPAPDDVQGWINEAVQILRENGIEISEADLERIWQVIAHESSGDPNAINDWDSNAAAGIPSQGLMQVIPPTFDAYKLPGHEDILNPVDNIIAGVRYTIDRYGSLAQHPGIESMEAGGPYRPYSVRTGRR